MLPVEYNGRKRRSWLNPGNHQAAERLRRRCVARYPLHAFQLPQPLFERYSDPDASYNTLPEVRDAVCQNSGDNYNASSFPVSLDVFVQRHLTSCFVVSGEPTARGVGWVAGKHGWVQEQRSVAPSMSTREASSPTRESVGPRLGITCYRTTGCRRTGTWSTSFAPGQFSAALTFL